MQLTTRTTCKTLQDRDAHSLTREISMVVIITGTDDTNSFTMQI